MNAFYVDVQNVGWEVVQRLPPGRVLVFCPPTVNADARRVRGVGIALYPCYENAVVVQLAAKLGEDLATNSAEHYTIVSNNQAFAPLVRQYRGRVSLEPRRTYIPLDMDKQIAIAAERTGLTAEFIKEQFDTARNGLDLFDRIEVTAGEDAAVIVCRQLVFGKMHESLREVGV